MVFEGACNELSLLSQHCPGELTEAWRKLRSVYLDIWEESGHMRCRVLQRLQRLEQKQMPRRLRAERLWRGLAASRLQLKAKILSHLKSQARPLIGAALEARWVDELPQILEILLSLDDS